MPLLVEKYRPNQIKDIIGFKPTFNIDDDLPNLLFYGPAGTGKTTAAKAIVRMLHCDYIILNASEERGIDVIRQKVIEFASTKSSNSNIKICIFDEADALTNDSLTALRNVIETYSSNTRFIFTCNYLQKIIDPIQSRCLLVKFNNIKKEDIINRLEYICKNENIPYELEAINKIVDQSGIDIRASINKIEEFKNGVLLKNLKNNITISENVFSLIKQKDFITSRQIYLDGNIDPEQFIKDLYTVIWNSTESDTYKQNATLILSDEYRWLSSVAWPQILIESLILKLIKL